MEVNLLKNLPDVGYQVRIIQHGGSNLIITKHASPKMLIHRGAAKERRVTVTERGQRVKPQGRGKRELKQKQRERERNKTAYRYWREE